MLDLRNLAKVRPLAQPKLAFDVSSQKRFRCGTIEIWQKSGPYPNPKSGLFVMFCLCARGLHSVHKFYLVAGWGV